MKVRICIMITVCYAIANSRFETDALKENIEQGHSKYQEFKDKARNAKNKKLGTCWANAVQDLESSCSKLDESTMYRLAYSFLTCHLHQHHRNVAVCDSTEEVERCTELLSDTVFGIYTSFIMHTHNMCFYIQSTTWQQTMDRTVDRLQDTSDDVAFNLQIQATKQQELLVGMDAVSDVNDHILSKTTELQRFISHLSTLVEKIGYIQQAFYSQFTTYEMILFYGGAILLTLLATSLPGCAAARTGMMGLTVMSFAVEQIVAQYGLVFDNDDDVYRYQAQKQIRRLWLLLCIGSWVRSLYIARKNRNNTQELLSYAQQTSEMLQDLSSKLMPLTAAYKNCMFSEDEAVFSDQTTQTDTELMSPDIIKIKKYSKKRKCGQLHCSTVPPSPGRSGAGRYNLRPITPPRTAPLAPPPITWPGFSSDENDALYLPGLSTSDM